MERSEHVDHAYRTFLNVQPNSWLGAANFFANHDVTKPLYSGQLGRYPMREDSVCEEVPRSSDLIPFPSGIGTAKRLDRAANFSRVWRSMAPYR